MAIVPTVSEGYNNVATGTAAILNSLQGSRQGSSSSTDWSSAAGYNYAMMKESMRFNRKERQKNRDWQEMMSNTSYQRAVKDMLAAGINPILRYTQGGASTPSGAQGTGAAARIGRNRKSRSFGISGLAEGVGQIIDSIENWYNVSGAKELINDAQGMLKDGLDLIMKNSGK